MWNPRTTTTAASPLPLPPSASSPSLQSSTRLDSTTTTTTEQPEHLQKVVLISQSVLYSLTRKVQILIWFVEQGGWRGSRKWHCFTRKPSRTVSSCKFVLGRMHKWVGWELRFKRTHKVGSNVCRIIITLSIHKSNKNYTTLPELLMLKQKNEKETMCIRPQCRRLVVQLLKYQNPSFWGLTSSHFHLNGPELAVLMALLLYIVISMAMVLWVGTLNEQATFEFN